MWVSPSVMFIEAAKDSLNTADPRMIESQDREINSFGDQRARELGASGLSTDFTLGYRLGLQTARMILAGSVQLKMKDIAPDSIL